MAEASAAQSGASTIPPANGAKIRVYNTLTRQKEPFEPVNPGKVGIYVCGPTVYSYSHIGHMVGPVIFDTIKKYLAYNGYDVSLVINITDIDDKIINQAAQEGCSIQELAQRVEADYHDHLDRLGVEVDHFPHATEYIDPMQEMIGGLVDRGHAYPAGGDVYFDVTSFPGYGKLSNRKVGELLAGSRKEVSDLKRSAADFVLWKGAKPGEPSWESPWGPGRPGWHIECSVMSMKLLGETFDIHGGGLDLVFPHHEDEVAQSECYSGKLYAKYWMHNGLMQYSDEVRKIGARAGDFDSQEQAKMSKSKGNVVNLRDLLAQFSPELIRYFLLATHYRSPISFSESRLCEVGSGLTRLHTFAELFERATGQSLYELAVPSRRADSPWQPNGSKFLQEVAEYRTRFLEFMDDDFNTGGAIAVLGELLTALNRFACGHCLESPEAVADKASLQDEFLKGATVLRELCLTLGILREPPQGTRCGDQGLLPKVLDLLVDVRGEARKGKNFAMADMIRDRLTELGIILQDGREGSRWKIEQ